MEDVPSITFLIPKKTPSDTHLVGFHLYLHMGYLDSDPYFFMARETVANLENEAIAQRDEAETRAADDSGAPEAQADVRWEHLPAEQRSSATANVNVYLDDFIYFVQGGPRERQQMLHHLFHQIDRVFHPNIEADTDRKEPIFRKNLGQGDGPWYTLKTVLRWDLDTIAHLLRLQTRRK